MNENIQAQAEIAAQWWVDRMTPFHSDTANIGGKQGDMVSMLQSMMAIDNVAKIETADYEAFKQALVECIVSEAAQRPDNYWLSLGMDYHPEGALREALQRVEKGKELASLLPFKHHMGITPQGVVAVAGYGAERVTLWTKTE